MITVAKLAKKINGSVEEKKNLSISGVGDLRTSPENFISFLSDERYYKYFKDSISEAVIVDKNFSYNRYNKTLIRVDNPVYAYIQAIECFNKTNSFKPEIHKSAIISKKASIGKNVYIGPNTVIDDDVKICIYIQSTIKLK